MLKKVVLVISLLLFISLLYYGFSPVLKAQLNGNDINIEVFSEYQDEGVDACYGSRLLGCTKKPNIEVINNINQDQLGEYEIIYKIKHQKKEKTLIRKVNVIDKTPPVLTLADEEITACPKTTDIDINYEAIDNYDGDLTSKVTKNIEDDVLNISVSDSSNNITSKSLKINYEDTEAPKITLSGSKTIYISLNGTYKEPGYKATDNCGGDLTKKVTTTNNIDTSKTGTYYVTYKVSDDFNNETTIKRTVKVIVNQPQISSGNKIIYLTFDDGPSVYTEDLLNILKQYNVKATFFVTWQSPNYASSIKRAYEEGHSIGLHTYSHVYSQVYSSIDAYFNDLDAINTQVKNLIGIDTKLIRFPGGSSNTVSRITPHIMTYLTGEVQARGYQYFDWNVSSNDTATSNSTTIANNVIKSLKGGTYIVLQHDNKKASVQAVKSIIEYGLANGYTFLPLQTNSPAAHHHINN